MAPTLSICIPIYNRVDCLKQLLDSIVSQSFDHEALEICISDNASEEDVKAVIKAYEPQLPLVVFHRFQENVGFDRNCLKVVEMAHGDYCWLMGSDDLILEGAIDYVLKKIHAEGKDALAGITVRARAYTSDLSESYPYDITFSPPSHDQRLEGIDTIIGTLSTIFGLISVHIVNRKFWNEVIASHDIEPYCTGYIHVYMMGKLFQVHPQWLYVHQICVGHRMENDLAVLHNRFGRLQLDVINYDFVLTGLFGKNHPYYEMWLRDILKVHIRSGVIGVKLHGDVHDAVCALKLTFTHYKHRPIFWYKFLPLLLTPKIILKGLRYVKKALEKGHVHEKVNG